MFNRWDYTTEYLVDNKLPLKVEYYISSMIDDDDSVHWYAYLKGILVEDVNIINVLNDKTISAIQRQIDNEMSEIRDHWSI